MFVKYQCGCIGFRHQDSEETIDYIIKDCRWMMDGPEYTFCKDDRNDRTARPLTADERDQLIILIQKLMIAGQEFRDIQRTMSRSIELPRIDI